MTNKIYLEISRHSSKHVIIRLEINKSSLFRRILDKIIYVRYFTILLKILIERGYEISRSKPFRMESAAKDSNVKFLTIFLVLSNMKNVFLFWTNVSVLRSTTIILNRVSRRDFALKRRWFRHDGKGKGLTNRRWEIIQQDESLNEVLSSLDYTFSSYKRSYWWPDRFSKWSLCSCSLGSIHNMRG